MDGLAGLPIGGRVAELRRRAGLTQAGLAQRLHRSVSWVSKVEQGRRAVDNVRTLIELKDALGVRLEDLREDFDPIRPGHEMLPALRRSLTMRRPPVDSTANPDVLRGFVLDAGRDWQDEPRCYTAVAPRLPPLIAQARALAEVTTGEAHRAALRTLALATQVGQEVAARLGQPDLSWIAARTAADAAHEAADPTLTAVGAWRLGHAALRIGDLDEARDLAAAAATELAPELREPAAATLSAYGALRLVGAIGAARAGDAGDAAALLAEARSAADRLGADRNDNWQAFGPANVSVHDVAVATELGDPTGALAAARRVDPGALPTIERRATYHVQVAQALSMRREDAEAVRRLKAAERLNPEGLPHDALAREIVRGLVRRDARRALPGLRELARRLRVPDS